MNQNEYCFINKCILHLGGHVECIQSKISTHLMLPSNIYRKAVTSMLSKRNNNNYNNNGVLPLAHNKQEHDQQCNNNGANSNTDNTKSGSRRSHSLLNAAAQQRLTTSTSSLLALSSSNNFSGSAQPCESEQSHCNLILRSLYVSTFFPFCFISSVY